MPTSRFPHTKSKEKGGKKIIIMIEKNMMCVITLMKILNENDMRSETGGSDSSMSTEAPTPCSYFGSSKVESLEMKNL